MQQPNPGALPGADEVHEGGEDRLRHETCTLRRQKLRSPGGDHRRVGASQSVDWLMLEFEFGINRILQSLTVTHTWRSHKRPAGPRGHVWQGRFKSPVIQDDAHLLVVLRYIEANPLRAGMVTNPAEYRWSSFPHPGWAAPDSLVSGFLPEWEWSWGEPRPSGDGVGGAKGRRPSAAG